jgi:hypothetical protein
MIKNVALIGSSGGGTATLGHTDAANLLSAIHEQLLLCGGRVALAAFVALDQGKGMDGANERVDTARMYTVNSVDQAITTLECHATSSDTLREVNKLVALQDQEIARAIRAGQIDGLVCISCHTQLFGETLAAAAATPRIAVTGSGGTSLAQAVAEYGVLLTGNVGGSVASTTYSRAVSYTYALATYWQRSYRPSFLDDETLGNIRWASVLNACLPTFWGVCLAKFALQSVATANWAVGPPQHVVKDILMMLENWTLPTSCAVIMATSTASSTKSTTQRNEIPLSSLVMASVLASCVCRQSVLGGLLAGWLVRLLTNRLFFYCIIANLPSTMTNLVSTGITGCAVATLLLPLVPLLRQFTVLVRWTITWSIVGGPLLVAVDKESALLVRCCLAFAWGCFCCYGSKVGWYHSYFLPAILIEMELGDASFLGAIDELALVLVCAGVCAGNLASLKVCQFWHGKGRTIDIEDDTLCRRGLYINLLCGDFVEVCYPYMDRHRLINFSGYIAAGLSSAVLVASATSVEQVPRSLAYLPLPLSILLAHHDCYRMAIACFVAAGIPFVMTLLVIIPSAVVKHKQA